MNKLLSEGEIRALSVADRLELIEDLWDSLESDALPLPDLHKTELDQRLDALESGRSVGRPWPEVRDRITRRS